VNHDLERACRASLDRSRARRAAVAERFAVLRRRRRRGGSASVAILGSVLALGAPLALGQTSAQAPAPVMLRAGASGSPVTAVQAALGVPQTGTFGGATQRAVRKFQRSHGLAIDGIVGPQTAAALGLPSGTAASAPASASAQDTTVAGTAAGVAVDPAALARIAQCESNGDPTAVSADGRYRGKYQFSRATWARLGGSGDPAAAPEAEQDRLAAQLLAAEGTAPWPVCGN
jgi:soluble lytic murein transglycosylase-like protein